MLWLSYGYFSNGRVFQRSTHFPHANHQAIQAAAFLVRGQQRIDAVEHDRTMAHHIRAHLVVVLQSRAALRIPGDDVQQSPLGLLAGQFVAGQQIVLRRACSFRRRTAESSEKSSGKVRSGSDRLAAGGMPAPAAAFCSSHLARRSCEPGRATLAELCQRACAKFRHFIRAHHHRAAATCRVVSPGRPRREAAPRAGRPVR